MMQQFKIPIVLFFFKRKDKVLRIMDQISKIKPIKLYLISDGPRNVEENQAIADCRQNVESAISWPCEVIKNYADVNRGVYDRIAKGAIWVFNQEESAIFLEDDNLPELTFFTFCEEMLKMYEDDTRILWVCGTNYLKQFKPQDGASYVFTRHMLPCGWASWSHKFSRFYDGDLSLWKDKVVREKVSYSYEDKRLYKQDSFNWDLEARRIGESKPPLSWDYQMGFSIRVHNLYGIVPKYNQIRNIGVDEYSVHGGTSMNNTMTERFCELPTKQLEFPLNHPKVILPDRQFELETAEIILYPLYIRGLLYFARSFKILFKIHPDFSFTLKIKHQIRKMNSLLSRTKSKTK